MAATVEVAIAALNDERRNRLAQCVDAGAKTTLLAGAAAAAQAFGERRFDALIVDLDDDVTAALALINEVSDAHAGLTIVVCSNREDSRLIVRAMRAGASEYLPYPPDPERLAEALHSGAGVARRAPVAGSSSKTFVFWGAKGGVGATTLATNFAIALREEAGRPVALADLNLHLGDVAVTLGLEPRFSTRDALSSIDRLDRDFLTALMAEHSSGVSVLAGPDEFGLSHSIPNGEFTTMLDVLKQGFPYAVLDGGPGASYLMGSAFRRADRIFLVVSADIPSVRNAKRILSHLESQIENPPPIDLVINRAHSKNGIDEDSVVRTLEASEVWKIPNDYHRVLESLNRGVSLFETQSPVLPVLRQMARRACGKPEPQKKSSPWSFLTGQGKK